MHIKTVIIGKTWPITPPVYFKPELHVWGIPMQSHSFFYFAEMAISTQAQNKEIIDIPNMQLCIYEQHLGRFHSIYGCDIVSLQQVTGPGN